jgi:hypothetical protein
MGRKRSKLYSSIPYLYEALSILRLSPPPQPEISHQ